MKNYLKKTSQRLFSHKEDDTPIDINTSNIEGESNYTSYFRDNNSLREQLNKINNSDNMSGLPENKYTASIDPYSKSLSEYMDDFRIQCENDYRRNRLKYRGNNGSYNVRSHLHTGSGIINQMEDTTAINTYNNYSKSLIEEFMRSIGMEFEPYAQYKGRNIYNKKLIKVSWV